jgi:hypothetical protein
MVIVGGLLALCIAALIIDDGRMYHKDRTVLQQAANIVIYTVGGTLVLGLTIAMILALPWLICLAVLLWPLHHALKGKR